MSARDEEFVAERPLLALLGVAVLALVIDVAVSVVLAGGIDPLGTGLFVVLVTGIYAFLLYRRGHLGG